MSEFLDRVLRYERLCARMEVLKTELMNDPFYLELEAIKLTIKHMEGRDIMSYSVSRKDCPRCRREKTLFCESRTVFGGVSYDQECMACNFVDSGGGRL